MENEKINQLFTKILKKKLEYFIDNHKIPHIIFYGKCQEKDIYYTILLIKYTKMIKQKIGICYVGKLCAYTTEDLAN